MVDGVTEFGGDAQPVVAPTESGGATESPSRGRRIVQGCGVLLVPAVPLACVNVLCVESARLSSLFLKTYVADYVWVASSSFLAYFVFDLLFTFGVFLAGRRIRRARTLRDFGVNLVVCAVIVGVAGPSSGGGLLETLTDSTRGMPFARTLHDPRLLFAIVLMCIWTAVYRSRRRRGGLGHPRMASVSDGTRSDVQGNRGIAPRRTDHPQSPFRQIARALGWGFGALLVLGGAAAARAVPALVGGVSHETGGWRQTFALADGSVVTLDANSQFQASISPYRREIHLSKGQAMIQIDRNWDQPFQIYAGSKGVAAQAVIVGAPYYAAIVVKVVQEDSIEVWPLESGTAEVTFPAQPGRASDPDTWHTLNASVQEVAMINSKQQTLERITQAEQVTRLGWLAGQVVFSKTPLAAAVAEMNRYPIDGSIVVFDASLADVPISGTFEESASGFVFDLQRACIVKSVRGGDEEDATVELQRADPDCKPDKPLATDE